MLSLLLRPLRQFVEAVLAHDSPRQVAAGCMLGMMLGLVPKDNLIAVALGVLICALRVNRPVALGVAGVLSLVSPLLDRVTHLMGEKLLTWSALEPYFTRLYDQPFGPWLGFNNTVVMGSLLLGLYLSFPCYWSCKAVWQRYQPRLANYVGQYRVARWLARADFAARLEG